MRNDFAVFILSHGRPDNVITLNTLKKANYTGKWYIVIDNEDDKADKYYKKYGTDKVIMFDKLEISKKFDTADMSQERRTVVYARNACFEIAEKLGLTYFLELDDDYNEFSYRKEIDGLLTQRVNVKQADKMFELMIDFLEKTQALTVAFGQGGDYVGGLNSGLYKVQVKRKAMNTFFCTTKRPFKFVGRINEDTNTYVLYGSRGHLFLTIRDVMIHQLETQSNKGGMTDVYLNSGTYLKSFYTVMMCPSCVKISRMGNTSTSKRIHHRIDWNSAVPKIISERYKKK